MFGFGVQGYLQPIIVREMFLSVFLGVPGAAGEGRDEGEEEESCPFHEHLLSRSYAILTTFQGGMFTGKLRP